MDIQRRDFLKASAAAAGGLLFSGKSSFGMAKPISKNNKIAGVIPKRPLGKTGEQLSLIGLGGIVVMNAEPEHAASVVAECVERGINYFDVAPTYGDAELKLGPALKPYRDKVFLACKTANRDRAGAKEELDASLKRLETDHFDLYQLHAITDVEEDVKAALGRDGVIQTFLEARKQGIIRYIGFSAHSTEAALTAMREFDFDTILYPINFCCHYRSGFDKEVLAEANKRNMGILAIKAMTKQRWQSEEAKKAYPKCWYEPIHEAEMARLALSWTLSQKGVTAALPPGEEGPFRIAMDVANSCGDISQASAEQLEKLSAELDPLFPLREGD